MAVTRVKLSYDEYLRLPEETRPCELIDGELVMPPSPSTRHQELVGRVFREFAALAEQNGLSKVFMAPLDVVLDRVRPVIVQPDVIVVGRNQLDIIGQRIEGAPALVAEVMSPASGLRDRTEKSVLYSQYGVQEYWLVDPDDGSIEVRLLTPEGYEAVGSFRAGETARSAVFPALQVPVQSILP